MKRILTLLLSILMLAVVFAGCTATTKEADVADKEVTEELTDAEEVAPVEEAAPAEEESAEIPKVAFICKAYSDAFCVWVKDEMESIATEKYGDDFTFVSFDAENNSNTQIDQIGNAVANGFDVIIFQQVDEQAPVNAIKEAVDQGITAIAVTGHILDDGASYYVDSSPKQQGLAIGMYAAENLPENAKVAILQGPAGNPHANGRQEGFEEGLATRSDIEIVDVQIGDWEKEKGLTLTQNWLQSIPDLAGILAHNDNMALGAYEAIKMAGKEDQIQIYGVDALAEAVLAVKEGKMMATVFQNAIGFAEKGLEYAFKAINEEEFESIILDSDLVTMDNVEVYIEFHKKLGNIE